MCTVIFATVSDGYVLSLVVTVLDNNIIMLNEHTCNVYVVWDSCGISLWVDR